MGISARLSRACRLIGLLSYIQFDLHMLINVCVAVYVSFVVLYGVVGIYILISYCIIIRVYSAASDLCLLPCFVAHFQECPESKQTI